MNISDLNNSVVFIEDLRALYGTGSISVPTLVQLSAIDTFDDGSRVESIILSESYYGDFDGRITLDYHELIRRLIVPVIPSEEILLPDESGGYRELKINFGGLEKTVFANAFSADAKKTITDIDYMAIPNDANLIVNVYDGWTDFSIYIQSGGRMIKMKDVTSTGSGKGFYVFPFRMQDLLVKNCPFRFVVKTESVMLQSCVYECMEKDFQQFLFSGRLGGYVFFALSGDLEASPTYEFETARYSDRYQKAYSERTPAYVQYSGGLTLKAFKVLSELLLSDYAFHLDNGAWRRIIIEEPDLSSREFESLHYGSFKFRYADDI